MAWFQVFLTATFALMNYYANISLFLMFLLKLNSIPNPFNFTDRHLSWLCSPNFSKKKNFTSTLSYNFLQKLNYSLDLSSRDSFLVYFQEYLLQKSKKNETDFEWVDSSRQKLWQNCGSKVKKCVYLFTRLPSFNSSEPKIIDFVSIANFDWMRNWFDEVCSWKDYPFRFTEFA